MECLPIYLIIDLNPKKTVIKVLFLGMNSDIDFIKVGLILIILISNYLLGHRKQSSKNRNFKCFEFILYVEY